MTLVCPEFNARVIQDILQHEGYPSDVIGTLEAGPNPDAEAIVRVD